ncbi:class I SAM-dependent methyltransferase [Streptomonospora arabica]|uniref:Class I SAM-dependent methyltransferase n=1 Tax=Streptomonospora arabica TaxID=412417 RepID=A0ABV9SPW8_9ACTN
MPTDAHAEPPAPHVAVNRAFWDEGAAAYFATLAPGQWSRAEPAWGHWAVPESRLRLLPDEPAGTAAVELGCGTGYVSAWLARAGARPVGVDVSAAQLDTARRMQRRFGIDFPLVLGDAENVPCGDGVFGLAISEHGASLWCDPHRWIPEAARLLAPGGRLVFLRYSPLFAMCRPEEGRAGAALRRRQFGLRRLEWGGSVEFTLPHGDMLRLLHSCGFEVEDLIEIEAPADAGYDYPYLSADWARSWPGEEVWKARLKG